MRNDGAVLLCGSRSLSVSAADIAAVVAAKCPRSSVLLSGGARGVDAVAPEVAKQLDMVSVVIEPCYALYGRSAPIVRNRTLLSLATYVIAVWDGHSRGTGFVVREARRLGLRVFILRP